MGEKVPLLALTRLKMANSNQDWLNNIREKTDIQERQEHIRKNPLWQEFYEIWDSLLNQSTSLDTAIDSIILLAEKFLEIDDLEELDEIFASFENLSDLLLVAFEERETKDLDETQGGRILSNFNSLLFTLKEEEIRGEIEKIRSKIKAYNAK